MDMSFNQSTILYTKTTLPNLESTTKPPKTIFAQRERKQTALSEALAEVRA